MIHAGTPSAAERAWRRHLAIGMLADLARLAERIELTAPAEDDIRLQLVRDLAAGYADELQAKP